MFGFGIGVVNLENGFGGQILYHRDGRLDQRSDPIN